MLNLFKSHWLESFLSRPFQLALGFTIVLYGKYLSASASLTLI